VAVGGEIDIMTGPQLREPLHDLIGRGVLHHVIDLSDVTFIDSTGLGILVGERRRLRERGGSVRVVCGPGIARRVLHLTAVDRLIDIHDTVEAAVAALGVP
jgi:anti-anti-sigma factor